MVLPVHSRVFDVVNRTPLVAWARGSSLLTEMAAALTGMHYDQRLNAASLVVFVGHDTNIANVGGLLGVNWQAEGYPPNDIPPAGVLFLELWGRGDKREVRVRFDAQPLEALHAPFDGEYPTLAAAPQLRRDVVSPAQSPDVRSAVQNGPGKRRPIRAVTRRVAARVSARRGGRSPLELSDFTQLVRDKTAGAPLGPQQFPGCIRSGTPRNDSAGKTAFAPSFPDTKRLRSAPDLRFPGLDKLLLLTYCASHMTVLSTLLFYPHKCGKNHRNKNPVVTGR